MLFMFRPEFMWAGGSEVALDGRHLHAESVEPGVVDPHPLECQDYERWASHPLSTNPDTRVSFVCIGERPSRIRVDGGGARSV